MARTPRSAITVALAGVLSLSGCAIAELQQDVKTREQRVDDKQVWLAAEQRNQAELAAERDRLTADLRSRELTATQLRARLDSMRKLNDSAPTPTPQAKQRQGERGRQLAAMANQAQALEQDQGLSQQERARRAEALRDKTRKALETLLDN